jgi:hypothetical protein
MNREADSSPSREPGGTLSSLARDRTPTAEAKATAGTWSRRGHPGTSRPVPRNPPLLQRQAAHNWMSRPQQGPAFDATLTAPIRRSGHPALYKAATLCRQPCHGPPVRTAELLSLRSLPRKIGVARNGVIWSVPSSPHGNRSSARSNSGAHVPGRPSSSARDSSRSCVITSGGTATPTASSATDVPGSSSPHPPRSTSPGTWPGGAP